MTRRLTLFLAFLLLAGLLAPAHFAKAGTVNYYGLSFDGSTSYVTALKALNITNAVTVVWIGKLQSYGSSSTSSWQNLVGQYSYYAGGFMLFWQRISSANGNIVALVKDSNGSYAQSVFYYNIPLNKVHMFAFSFNTTSGVLKTYADGGEGTTAQGNLKDLGNLSQLTFGIQNTWGRWKGEVYEILVYNRTLSDQEVQAIYQDPLNPPTDGLVLWYAPDSVDPSANVWHDKSGNGNDGTIYGATPERVSIPSASYYDIENNSEIPVENVSVSMLANNTTISLIPSFLTLPWNQTVTLNVSAVGYESRTLSILTTINSLAVYLQPLQSNTTTNPIQPPTETISPLFKISDNYNDQGLWGGRLGIYFLTGNWSEGFRRFWTLNPMFELVLPVIFAFGIILSSYLVTRKPLIPVGTTAVMATFFGMLGIPLQLSIATPLAALFIFWIVYILWGFYKRFERS